MRVTCLLIAAFVAGAIVPAHAQVPGNTDTPAPAVTPNEDIEPRVIGNPGTMALGLAGSVDQTTSGDDDYPPFNLTLQVELSRFLTRSIAVRGGVVGSAALGGDPDDRTDGTGQPALHAFGAGLYYFSPQSIASVYAGAGYWYQLTARGDSGDAGSVLGLGGVDAAVSSRAMVFVEGGYGIGLTKTGDGATRQRFLARVGVRLKL
jgi:hypothetical protein